MGIKEKSIVEKRNVLNELRANNMTLQELRFFSIYLSMINARDPDSRIARFTLLEFQKIMELGRINISHIKGTTDSLLCKIITIFNENGGYTSFQLFKECKVDKDKNGEWYVEIDCHDKALPYLFEYQAKYFTYQLWNALRLKSSNQLRMYEILKQYQRIGEREITVEKLRSLIGISKNEYPRWERFKTRVIDVCQKALRENTDIKFTYEPIKKGQGGKIIAINFKIEKNDDYVDQLTLDEFIDFQPETAFLTEDEYKEVPIYEDLENVEEIIFKNEKLEFLAEACEREFTEEQMQVLYDMIIKIVPFGSSKNVELERYDLLRMKYNDLKYRASNKNLAPVTNRFAYLRTLLKSELESQVVNV